MSRMFRMVKVGALAMSIGLFSAAAMAADIVDTAVGAGQFKTLVAAVQAAGLTDTLKDPGPFTVFAPTDAAFAKLPAGTGDSLLKPENKAKLVTILTYHVVPGTVMAKDVAGKKVEVKTVEGSEITVDGTGSAVKVDNATVTSPDIVASNGVIHVIDIVMMPCGCRKGRSGNGDTGKSND